MVTNHNTIRDPNVRKCRNCPATSDKTRFKKGKNLCIDCSREYMKEWKEKNKDKLKEYRSTPEFKKKRQKSVRKSLQKSPEAFIRGLVHHITKYSNY